MEFGEPDRLAVVDQRQNQINHWVTRTWCTTPPHHRLRFSPTLGVGIQEQISTIWSRNFSEFIRTEDTTPAEFTITTDGAIGVGLQKSSRAIREEENECAIGGLRNAARAVARLPGWSVVGTKVASVALEKVLGSLGDITKSCVVPETLCAQLRQRLGALLALNNKQLQPVPGGLFPGEDFLRLPKTLTSTFTSGSGVRSRLVCPPKFHLAVCSPWSRLRVWDERKTGFGIYMPKCGARSTAPVTRSTRRRQTRF